MGIKSAQESVMEDRLLTPRETFRTLNVSQATGYRLLSRGELPCVRIGRAIRIPAGALRRWIESRTTGGSECAA
jgi:excisionase family DNA binding protein